MFHLNQINSFEIQSTATSLISREKQENVYLLNSFIVSIQLNGIIQHTFNIHLQLSLSDGNLNEIAH